MDFDGFRPGRPEITVPASTSGRSDLAKVVRSSRFSEIAVTRRFGIPVASEAETVLALSGRLSLDELERVLASRLNGSSLKLAQFDDLRHAMTTGGMAGRNTLLRLIDERDADAWEPPGTELERHLDRVLGDPRIPAAIKQTPLNRFAFSRGSVHPRLAANRRSRRTALAYPSL